MKADIAQLYTIGPDGLEDVKIRAVKSVSNWSGPVWESFVQKTCGSFDDEPCGETSGHGRTRRAKSLKAAKKRGKRKQAAEFVPDQPTLGLVGHAADEPESTYEPPRTLARRKGVDRAVRGGLSASDLRTEEMRKENLDATA
jgi:hypothetical protein